MIGIRTILITIAIALFAPTTASAASGYVKGRLLFYQNQGNFCPTYRNCTGANYLQSSFNWYNPISEVKVYLKNEATGILIGQGTTDTNGDFLISWYSTAFPIQGTIFWLAEHAGGRFTIQDGNGALMLLWSAPFNLVNGTTFAAPQERGYITWGSAGAPNPIANVYDGAWRMWYYSLSFSSRMISNFANLGIRAFSTVCGTSCAYGSANYVNLDPNSAYRPQSRVMHEMGHIASYKSNAFEALSNYCYPSTDSSCAVGSGWNATSAEWKASSFEEGLASFFATVGLYWSNAPAPHNCGVAQLECTTDVLNIETSNGASCATDETRFEVSTERFLWDVYDIYQENFIFTGDFSNRPYYDFFDRLASFPNGRNDHEDDEPWGYKYFVDNHDGRSSEDIAYWFNVAGFNQSGQRAINCNP